MAAGRPALEDSQMTFAAVAEIATTQFTTSSRIRVVETEDKFNTEMPQGAGRHVRSARNHCGHGHVQSDRQDDRSQKIVNGWTQQVVDRNKKCCGAKIGHLGILFESQLANIEKLEVAEITLQETIARTTEIVYAEWLDDVARGTPEDPAVDRSSEDAIITASRMLSMAATKVIE